MQWSSNLAYVVGLIATDGCLSNDKRHIILPSKDLEQIENFMKILKLNNKVGTNKNGNNTGIYYRIQFSNVNLYRWLLKIGLSAHKSLSLGPLKIHNKYFRDFLRGNLDGDGCITYYKDKYNSHINPKYIYDRLFVTFCSGSKKYLAWLQETINKQLKIHGAINTKHNRRSKNNYYVLKFSTKEAKILLNWIYHKPDLPCLGRKLKIAKPFLNIYQQESTRYFPL